MKKGLDSRFWFTGSRLVHRTRTGSRRRCRRTGNSGKLGGIGTSTKTPMEWLGKSMRMRRKLKRRKKFLELITNR